MGETLPLLEEMGNEVSTFRVQWGLPPRAKLRLSVQADQSSKGGDRRHGLILTLNPVSLLWGAWRLTWWRFHLANDTGDPANFSLNKQVVRWISLQ